MNEISLDDPPAPLAQSRPAASRERISRSEKALCLLFLFSLAFLHPVVHGDGAGYYAFVRAWVVQRDMHFEKDWRAAFPHTDLGRPDGKGNVNSLQYTTTGHLDNYFAVGPAILWLPFIAAAHLAVLAWNAAGNHVAADGFSKPYLVAMALGTAIYGFLGLLISFRLARRYFAERWAFLATLGIWLATSLHVYMYIEPAWSHAQSAFAVALFLWYWDRTRDSRTYANWAALAVFAGLMIDVYWMNSVFLLVPALEFVSVSWSVGLSSPPGRNLIGLLLARIVFFLAIVALFVLPTFLVKQILYGSAFHSGYLALSKWDWTSPHFLAVLFSATHGLLSWTPILIPALIGLALLGKRAAGLGKLLLACFAVFYYVIAAYPLWSGVTSFGNRYFVSFTPVFVLGLACALDRLGKLSHDSRGSTVRAGAVVFLLILWNLGFAFQWATHMIADRGPVAWKEMIYNQFRVVPGEMAHSAWKWFGG